MPLFEYRCTHCGHLQEELRQAQDREKATGCTECGWMSKPVLSTHTVKPSPLPRT